MLSRSVPVFWPPCDWGLCAGIRVDISGRSEGRLPPVIKDLIRWRHRNGLSQRGASEVMQAHGLDVKIGALKQWEQGMREPGSLAVKALRDFLTQHPRIENPPRYRPGPK
jgi:hypothetical protein